jgi:SAM-dependent methyltransferase
MSGPACLVCASDAGFAATLRDLARCRRCGFVTYRGTNGVDPRTLYGAAYFRGSEYPDYHGQEPAIRRSMRRHLRQMARYAPLGGTLLEIGCAFGFFLGEARVHFRRVVGIDVADAALAHARDALGLDVRAGDFLTLDLAAERFDVVCLWDTVEHLARPDAYLGRAHEVLAPGGLVFLTTGDIGSRNARLRGARWRLIHPPTHLHYFSRSTIARLLERTGFQVAGIETAAYYHTLFSVLGSLAIRGGAPGRLAARAAAWLGPRVTNRLGVFVNLGDIMFVAARRRPSASSPPG